MQTWISAQQCEIARALMGWSQAELANKAQVTLSTVAKFERGSVPVRNTLIAIIRSTFERHGLVFEAGSASARGKS